MLIENNFTVLAPIDRVWAYLLDVERVAPCMPGAELTEVVDDENWKGRMNVKFGPVAMVFAGTVTMKERDDEAHRVVLGAQGQESKGKGAANATVTSWLEPDGDQTTVKMQADIALSGFVAQVSRGMLPDISARLTQQFADCLQESMAAEGAGAVQAGTAPGGAGTTASDGTTPAGAPVEEKGAAPTEAAPAAAPRGAPSPAAPKALGGFRLALWALVRWIGRAIGRLFGRRYD